jgi:hypothetical protein
MGSAILEGKASGVWRIVGACPWARENDAHDGARELIIAASNCRAVPKRSLHSSMLWWL